MRRLAHTSTRCPIWTCTSAKSSQPTTDSRLNSQASNSTSLPCRSKKTKWHPNCTNRLNWMQTSCLKLRTSSLKSTPTYPRSKTWPKTSLTEIKNWCSWRRKKANSCQSPITNCTLIIWPATSTSKWTHPTNLQSNPRVSKIKTNLTPTLKICLKHTKMT